MNEQSKQWDKETRVLAWVAATGLVDILLGYNVHLNMEGQERIAKVLAKLLIDFRQIVINDKMQSETMYHINSYHAKDV